MSTHLYSRYFLAISYPTMVNLCIIEFKLSIFMEAFMSLQRNGSKSCALINGYQEICGSRSESQGNEQLWNSGRSMNRAHGSNDERNGKVLEVDSGKPHFTLKRRNLSYSTGSDLYSKSLNSTKESTSLQSAQSPCCEVQSHSYSSQNKNQNRIETDRSSSLAKR